MKHKDYEIGQTVFLMGRIGRKETEEDGTTLYYFREYPIMPFQKKDIVWSPVEKINRSNMVIRAVIGFASGLLGAAVAIALFIV